MRSVANLPWAKHQDQHSSSNLQKWEVCSRTSIAHATCKFIRDNFFSSIDISDEASRSVIWSQGTFSSIVSKSLNIEDTMLSPESSITCTFTLEKTPYHQVRWQRIPRPPREFFRQPVMNSARNAHHSIIVLIVFMLKLFHEVAWILNNCCDNALESLARASLIAFSFHQILLYYFFIFSHIWKNSK